MIVAVIGSRDFSDYALLESTLASLPGITGIITGGARGADSLAEIYAGQYGLPIVVLKPDWEKYGQGAGVVRNRQIIDAAEMVVAFWDEVSRGTASSLKLAKAKGIPIQTVIIGQDERKIG